MTVLSSKLKVLVVDDEEVIADSLAIILKHNGFEALAAYSGKSSLEAAMSFKPDLLLTDVVMPDMTGIEAALEIRSLLPQCKVLLFSGEDVAADLIDEARARGHEFEIVAKPIHPTYLLAQLRSQAAKPPPSNLVLSEVEVR